MGRASRPGWGLFAVVVLVLSILVPPAGALDVPPLTGRVVDLAGALPSSVRERLADTLAEHERTTGNQVAVLIVPSLEGEDLFTFSHRVATTWRLGEKGTDNGALLLVALKDRKIRIEVGYGLEGALTDARSSQIIRHAIAPRFRAGDIPGGVTAGVEAILQSIAGTYEAPTPAQPAADHAGRVIDVLFAVMLGTVIGLVVSGFHRRLGPLVGGALSFLAAPWVLPALLSGGIALAIVAWLRYRLDEVPSPTRRGRGGRRTLDDGWWYTTNGGGWSSDGYAGGGDLGFSGGGGDFGGGGASGDW